jgi:hypothetical protein
MIIEWDGFRFFPFGKATGPKHSSIRYYVERGAHLTRWKRVVAPT